MNYNKAIDKVISELYREKMAPLSRILTKAYFEEHGNYNIEELDKLPIRIAEIMIHKGLIEGATHVKTLTPLGKEIFESGGWIKHLKRETTKKYLNFTSLYLYPLIALLIGAAAYWTDNNRETQLNKMELRIKSLDSIQNVTRNSEKELRERLLRQEKTLDSLKLRGKNK